MGHPYRCVDRLVRRSKKPERGTDQSGNERKLPVPASRCHVDDEKPDEGERPDDLPWRQVLKVDSSISAHALGRSRLDPISTRTTVRGFANLRTVSTLPSGAFTTSCAVSTLTRVSSAGKPDDVRPRTSSALWASAASFALARTPRIWPGVLIFQQLPFDSLTDRVRKTVMLQTRYYEEEHSPSTAVRAVVLLDRTWTNVVIDQAPVGVSICARHQALIDPMTRSASPQFDALVRWASKRSGGVPVGSHPDFDFVRQLSGDLIPDA